MKRLMHIMFSVTLSMLIVFMGSGLTIVHCNHTGNTIIVNFGQMCKKKCNPTAKCMTVSTVKCSTMAQASVQTLEHPQPISILPWLIQPAFELINPILLSSSDDPIGYLLPKHKPPRDYLNMICVLLI